MTGNSGKYNLKTAGAKELVSTFASESVTFKVAATDPEGAGNFNMSGTMAGLSGTSKAMIPEGVDMQDMNAALRAGMLIDGTFTYGGGTYAMDFKDATQSMTANVTGTGGGINLKMSQDGMAYGGNGGATQMNVTGSQIPFPVDISLAESAFNFVLPVSRNPTRRNPSRCCSRSSTSPCRTDLGHDRPDQAAAPRSGDRRPGRLGAGDHADRSDGPGQREFRCDARAA